MKVKLFILAITLPLVFSCTKDFEELNTNPNSIQDAPFENLLVYTEMVLANRYGGTELLYPAAYVGHATKYRYIEEIQYITNGPGGPWDWLYVNALSNLEFLIKEAKEQEHIYMQAVAMVLRAYAFHLLVDMYGPIPYTQANKGTEGIIFPEFDTEDVVYYDLLDQLRQANNLLASDAVIPVGAEEQIYNGSKVKWQRFCNSLRLRLAMRISNVAEDSARNNISEILNNPDMFPLISSNSDNAAFDFPDNDANYKEPWSSHSEITLYRIGKPLVDKMNELNDPRREYYADSIKSSGAYVGIVIGAESPSGVCKIDKRFSDNDGGAVYFMKYCEVEFLKAEAIVRGFADGDAQTAYENAVKASLGEYNIGADSVDAFLAETNVAWNVGETNTEKLNKIYIQKWISLFHQSWEAWAEMRRTDVPVIELALSDHKDNGTHNRVPFRFNYPSSVDNLNGANKPNINEVDFYWGYQIWWDTRTSVY